MGIAGTRPTLARIPAPASLCAQSRPDLRRGSSAVRPDEDSRGIRGRGAPGPGDGPLRPRLAASLCCWPDGCRTRLSPGSCGRHTACWSPHVKVGLPRVLIEALALGLPCVSFDVGGCADMMGGLRARYVAPDADLDWMAALAAAAVRFLPDEASSQS
ncbi:glycosyltransferase [Streptomyces sp. NPDC019531]|uniref:glycosyltransferase n=1 Tax=Streptomyces sp. NPDC019531 TaxID=3365062 RepID=UPI00384D5B20